MDNLIQLLKRYESEIEVVQSIIESKLNSEAKQLTTISCYLNNLGGKKVRPLLALGLGKAFGLPLDMSDSAQSQLFTLSAGIEMIHMATLLHDDTIDKSKIRRHKASAYAKYGLEDTLLAGDFLLVRAFGLCSKLSPPLVEATEFACVALTEGEILEKSLPLSKVSLEQAIDIAQKKTASLFELATFAAAFVAGLDSSNQKKAAEFGRCLGIGFQIVDDILDVASSDDILGKPRGQDLRERKPSIVNLLWLASGSENANKLLFDTDEDIESWVVNSLQEIQTSTILPEARQLASKYFARAQELLSELRLAAGQQQSTTDFDLISGLVSFAQARMY